jgi:hypothetical protein
MTTELIGMKIVFGASESEVTIQKAGQYRINDVQPSFFAASPSLGRWWIAIPIHTE